MAETPLALRDGATRIEAWPAILARVDESRLLTIGEMRAQRESFAAPTVPRGNFGQSDAALWLRLPVTVEVDRRRWILEVDYPQLNRIDAYVFAGDLLVQQAAMGSKVPATERPMRSRSHTMFLDLDAGSYEVYLRVQGNSTLVVPLFLHDEACYVAHESTRMLMQGLMFGVTSMLLVFSVFQGIGLRDRVFVWYAGMLIGVSIFFIPFTGLGQLLLWDAQVGALEKMAPMGALIALSCASLFAEVTLQASARRPRLALALRGVAGVGALCLVAAVLGWLDYRQVALSATVLGPIPILLALSESLRQARGGSRMARYLVLGWSAYTVGAVTMAALLRGLIPADFLTMHLFQFASLVEMIAWMRVLSLRLEDLRRDAAKDSAEKSALHALAHTDALTGLPNRRGMALALKELLPEMSAERRAALYLLDLDGFKAVNDDLGHEAGDALLVEVGRRLRSVLRPEDTVARIGGDEFVVLMAAQNEDDFAIQYGKKHPGCIRTRIPHQRERGRCRSDHWRGACAR